MTDTTSHAEVIREALMHFKKNAFDGYGYEMFGPADKALAALDALTRELAVSKSEAMGYKSRLERTDCRNAGPFKELSGSHCPLGKPCDRCQWEREEAAQAARIAKLEEALERIKGHTCPDMAPGTPAPDPRWIHAIARAALAPKEAQG